jgi:hypothetical protein
VFHRNKYQKIQTFAVKNNIASQESKEKFPSDIDNSEIYFKN